MSIQAFKTYLNQNILSILIQKDGFSFLSFSNKKVQNTGFVKINSDAQNFGEAFIRVFKNHEISKFKTEFVEVSFLSHSFTFIPKEDFIVHSAEEYLQLHNIIDPFAPIRYNPIFKQKSVVCFNYNEEIEYFLDQKYPFVKFIHNATRLLEKIPKNITNGIQLIYHTSEVEIIGLTNAQLEYYNIIPTTEKNDAFYALKHFLQDKEEKNYTIYLYGKYRTNVQISDLEDTFSSKVTIPTHEHNYGLISI